MLGHKLTGERVYGIEMRGAWVRVHEPCEGVTSGWMLTDATGMLTDKKLALGILMTRSRP